MSPASRLFGLMFVIGAGVKLSALFITPLVFAVLAGAFVLTLLIGWLLSPGRG